MAAITNNKNPHELPAVVSRTTDHGPNHVKTGWVVGAKPCPLTRICLPLLLHRCPSIAPCNRTLQLQPATTPCNRPLPQPPHAPFPRSTTHPRHARRWATKGLSPHLPTLSPSLPPALGETGFAAAGGCPCHQGQEAIAPAHAPAALGRPRPLQAGQAPPPRLPPGGPAPAAAAWPAQRPSHRHAHAALPCRWRCRWGRS